MQLGVEPPHAVVLGGLSAGHLTLIDVLDGSLDRADLDRLAARVGLRADEVTHLLEVLIGHGLLLDAGVGTAPSSQSDAERARLGPDLVSLALVHGAAASARAVLDRRSSSWVDVRGAGRVGSAIATLLSAAGVGRVSVADPVLASPADQSPAGLAQLAIGGSRELATRERIHAVAASVRVARRDAPASPHLVVLAPEAGPDSSARGDLVAAVDAASARVRPRDDRRGRSARGAR